MTSQQLMESECNNDITKVKRYTFFVEDSKWGKSVFYNIKI